MSQRLSPGSAWVAAQFAVLGTAALVPILRFWVPAPVGLWGAPFSGFELPLAAAGAFVALGLAGWAVRSLGRNLTALPKPLDHASLVVSGPYRFLRHPIYTALLLLTASWSIGWKDELLVGLSAALGIIFVFKSRLEEAWLLARYPEYADYRGRTGGLIPRFRPPR